MSELANLFEYEVFESKEDDGEDEGPEFIVYARRGHEDLKYRGLYRVVVEYASGSIERFWVAAQVFDDMKKFWNLEETDETIMLLDTEA